VKYSFIAQNKQTVAIDLMSQVLGVSRSGYYAYQKRQRHLEGAHYHENKLQAVRAIAIASGYTYGRRRIKRAMNTKGYKISVHHASKLMKEAGISVRHRKKYKVTTDSNHKQPIFDNLLNRQFSVERANQSYVSDVTYIWTQEGWLYLAVVIDLYSRKVVGWSMSSRMKASLVCNALNMAIWQRKPGRGLIHHSDRGSQYASLIFRALLKGHKIRGSMSRKGNCWDNAVAESFFGSLKQERVHWRHYQTRYQAQQDILNYITMFYNSTRLHSYLDYKSPNQYELEMGQLKNAA